MDSLSLQYFMLLSDGKFMLRKTGVSTWIPGNCYFHSFIHSSNNYCALCLAQYGGVFSSLKYRIKGESVTMKCYFFLAWLRITISRGLSSVYYAFASSLLPIK